MDITDRTDQEKLAQASLYGFKDRLEILMEIGGDMILPCGLSISYINRFGAFNKLFRYYGETKDEDAISFFYECLYLLRNISQISHNPGSLNQIEHEENETLIRDLLNSSHGLDPYDFFDSTQRAQLYNYWNWLVDPDNYQPVNKDKESPKEGYVYLMVDKRNGFHKIGFTKKEPKYREATLQSQQPEIELVWSVWKNLAYEKYLHEIFADKRVRGEWFDLDENDLQEIFEMSEES